LLDRKLLKDIPESPGSLSYNLTFQGWERFEELSRSDDTSRTAFMAMKFGRPQTESLFVNYLRPAVAKTGFDLQRVDHSPKAGLIDQKMEVAIRTARFLVAELTHGNRGAYWEAGFASGLGKPVFYVCEANRFRRVSTHFDTNHHFTVLWNAENPHKAADELKNAIRATLPADAKLTDD
jgi:hypothetical protein